MSFCPNCGREIAANAIKCEHRGATFGEGSQWQPLSAPPQAPARPGEPLYFPVSISKLIVLSMSTMGLYVIYWFYRNWKMEQQRAGRGWPILLTFFCPLSSYLLFDSIRTTLVRHSVPKIDAGLLALSFLALNLAWRLPDPYWIFAILSFFPPMIAQASINELNARVAPDAPRNDRYSRREHHRDRYRYHALGARDPRIVPAGRRAGLKVKHVASRLRRSGDVVRAAELQP
jgi:hypothetical protein